MVVTNETNSNIHVHVLSNLHSVVNTGSYLTDLLLTGVALGEYLLLFGEGLAQLHSMGWLALIHLHHLVRLQKSQKQFLILLMK